MTKKFNFKNTWLYRYIISAIKHPKNFIFCCKYPFYKVKNRWTGKFAGYDFTEYESIDQGWRKAFGEKLTADIVKALKASNIPYHKWEKSLIIEDIKEKYGELRFYVSAPELVNEVFYRYELLSLCRCQYCGNPVRYKTSGWISYLCFDCYKEKIEHEGLNFDFHDSLVAQQIAQDRLRKNDIPTIYIYKDGVQTTVDIKAKYNINFEKEWDL